MCGGQAETGLSDILPRARVEYWDDPGNAGQNSGPSPRQILRIALNLKFLVDKTVPITYDVDEVICEHSPILNAKVISLAFDACGGDLEDSLSQRKYQSVLIFCLLRVYSWYCSLAESELHNVELYNLRATATQQLCKLIIARKENTDLNYLFMEMLLRRYSINENDVDLNPISALELALDMHCTMIIGSCGYQRCLKWLWRGWIVQNEYNPETFILSDTVASVEFKKHFTPDRIRSPIYQNWLQIIFSIIYLMLYTKIVNSKDSENVAPLDNWELLFCFFTTGYVADEASKLYHVGWNYLGFWNVYNDTMYTVISLSIVLRIVSVSPALNIHQAQYWDMISYRTLSCAAPLVWSRLLLNLESERFVGALLVVMKHMMKESVIFFFLLILILIGFLQGFLGLDSSDGRREITGPILSNLVITVLGGGGFDLYENFAPPYAAILYYSYHFIVSVILLNILVALYSTAYQNVTQNSTDEYLTLMAQKTLRYIRAPDERVYVPPFNLIELALSPILWRLSRSRAKLLSHYVLIILYFPILAWIAVKEVREAKRVTYNRLKKLPDDANEIDVAWDLTDGFVEDESLPFSETTEGGIKATNKKNQLALKLQREAEQLDPKFPVPKTWFKKVRSAAQPVKEGFQTGLGWTSYGLYKKLNDEHKETSQKVDELTKMVKDLTDLVSELKNNRG
ncbi:Yvc1p Ecym_5363 [Eremothecium cymbalariae DBVPG|uniref:Ion transport domain-containing protein n=1 Tax=Eremothecium cymbalariae (strain CBS 270.75 / DBVPG 7215 / KCTC 17166 / NRRL Y-17582) TaxID=931890 RepID=I6NDH9_ERECY|nr:hypothetical protein Ecym_5363 [Eremothecium cymbalariae DBVPG\